MPNNHDAGGGEPVVDKEQLVRLLWSADRLLPEIDHDIEKSGLFSPPLSYRRRLKKEPDILGKVVRKRILQPHYELSNVQDIIGIRFITKLRLDIAAVVENIFRLISGRANFHSSVFQGVEIADYRQYTSSQTTPINPETGEPVDPLREKLKALIPLYFPDDTITDLKEEQKPQYSSVHLVLIHRLKNEGPPVDIPIEIQVRSVFEEAWGEIDHMIFYHADREGVLSGRRKRMAARRHLGILKTMLDNAGDYATLIAETDFDKQGEPPPNIRKSLDGLAHIEEIIEPLTAHRELLDEFASLIREKDRLDGDPHSGSRNLRYVALADQFLDLLTRLQAVSSPEDFRGQEDRYEAVMYLVSMEEALCRLLSGMRSQVPKARDAYEAIVSTWPDYPTGWFRLAQSNVLLMEQSDLPEVEAYAEEAFNAYGRSRALLDASATKEHLVVSPGQREYLDSSIERLQSFALWRVVDKRREAALPLTPADRDQILRAWKVAHDRLMRIGRPLDSEAIKLLNSATYFGLEAMEMQESLGGPRENVPSLKLVERLAGELNECASATNVTDPNTWHTVMRVALRLDDVERAALAAERVLDAHAKEDLLNASPYERDSHQRAFRDAWDVFKRVRRRDPA